MPNRTVNDIFSQTGKLAIVTGLIGELANLAISQLLRWQQRKRSNEAFVLPGLYWLMCFSEHATFPGPRRLTQQHIATLFKSYARCRGCHGRSDSR
jgi:hypothetical protein